MMDSAQHDRIAAWLVERGLAGAAETDLLHGFCERCRNAGVPISRGGAFIDTLHPIYEGRGFRWRNDGVDEPAFFECGRTNEGEAAANWQRSPFYHLLTTGADEFRSQLAPGAPLDFVPLETMRAEGRIDYLASCTASPA